MQRNTNRLIIGGLLSLMILSAVMGSIGLINAFTDNINRIRVFQAWEKISIKESDDGDAINDGIPDSWNPCSWGGARGFYEIEDQDLISGKYSIRINHTNDAGTICLSQVIEIPGDSKLLVKVYSKGDGGQIQTRIHDHNTGNWIDYGFNGWREIKPSADWQQYQFSFEVPPDIDQVELRLRGANLYDDAYIGIINDNSAFGQNLLENPSFEIDGSQQNPLAWWNDNIISKNAGTLSKVNLSSLSYLNIIDMLKGSYASIRERARILGDDCVQAPEMTGFMISKGMNVRLQGSLPASERMYQLSIDLMPNCPQPYAELANLYSLQSSYLLAADFYHKAAELAGMTPLAGRYSFEEGFIHVRHTGLIDQAIPALEKAEKFKGWERSSWHQGAATFFLGTAYEEKDMLEDAMLAYQRVLDCLECSEHQDSAKIRLDNLVNIQTLQK